MISRTAPDGHAEGHLGDHRAESRRATQDPDAIRSAMVVVDKRRARVPAADL